MALAWPLNTGFTVCELSLYQCSISHCTCDGSIAPSASRRSDTHRQGGVLENGPGQTFKRRTVAASDRPLTVVAGCPPQVDRIRVNWRIERG